MKDHLRIDGPRKMRQPPGIQPICEFDT